MSNASNVRLSQVMPTDQQNLLAQQNHERQASENQIRSIQENQNQIQDQSNIPNQAIQSEGEAEIEGNVQGKIKNNQVSPELNYKLKSQQQREQYERLSPIEFLIEKIPNQNKVDGRNIIKQYIDQYLDDNPDSTVFSVEQLLCCHNLYYCQKIWAKCFNRKQLSPFEVNEFKKSFIIKEDLTICRFYGTVYFQSNDIHSQLISLKNLNIQSQILDNQETFPQQIEKKKIEDFKNLQEKLKNIDPLHQDYDLEKKKALDLLNQIFKQTDFEKVKQLENDNEFEQNSYTYDFERSKCCEYGFCTSEKELYIGQFFNNRYHGQGRLWKDFEKKDKDKECEEFFAGEKVNEIFQFANSYQNTTIPFTSNSEIEIIPKKANEKESGEFVKRVKDKYQYAGQFKNNKFNGWGIINFENGNQYKGQWKDDLMHGMGHFIWVNGEEYLGEYYKGKKHGFGKYTYLNKTYLGNFWNGKQHGIGLIKKGNGQYIEIKHDNGEMYF